EPSRDVDVASGCAIASVQNLVLPFIAIAVPIVPSSLPFALSPIAAVPAREQRTIYRTALGEFKHPILSISASRVDPQNLDNAWIGVDAKRRVPHTER